MAQGDTVDVRALLRRLLRDADALGLDTSQFNTLSRLYLQHAVPAWTDVEAVLSDGQLRAAVAGLVAEEAPKTVAAEAVADYAKTADTKYLEMELTGRVAERLASWMKLFAYFIALPVSALLLLLAVFGISKFDDVLTVGGKANEALANAQQHLSKLADREHEIDRQLATLTSKSQSASRQIAQLDCRTQHIESKLGTASALMWSDNGNIGDAGSIGTIPFLGRTRKAYGPWKILPEMAADVAAHSKWASRFAGLKLESAEFDAQWRAAAAADQAGFLAAQSDWIKRTQYDVSAAKILKDEHVDVNKLSPATQEILFTWEGMTGPGDHVFKMAADSMRASGNWKPDSASFDSDLQAALYDTLRNIKYFREHPSEFTRFKRAIGASISGVRCAG